MVFSRIVNFLLIVIGGLIAFYAQAGADQNQYLLVAGIFVLMTGVYRLSRNIPSKHEQEGFNDHHDEF